MTRRLPVLLLVLCGSVARAEDAPPATPVAPVPAPAPKPTPPPTPEQAADAVLAAVAAKDDAALKALAAKDEPDPWLVADELIRRSEFDTADAFAKAAPRVDVEALPAYVASRRGKPDDPARRERLAKANAALQARKPADVLAALGPEEPGPIEDVVGVRLAMGRGFAYSAVARLDASMSALVAAGEAALRLGWLVRAASAFYQAGAIALRGSAFVFARAAWERELSIRDRRGDAAGAAGAIHNLGIVDFKLGEYPRALSKYERALAAYDALGDKERAVNTLSNIASIHHRRGEYTKALAAYGRALAAQEALWIPAGALTLGNLGVVHYEFGDYATALAVLERAFAAQETLGYKAEAAGTLGNLGHVHARLGNYAKALAIHERALAAKEALGDRAGAAVTLRNIGVVHASVGEYGKALAMYERALAAQEALGDRNGAAETLSSLAAAHLDLGDAGRALAIYERVLAAWEALGDGAGVANAIGNIGVVHSGLGDYARALASLERSLAANVSLGLRAGAAATLGSIGTTHLLRGDLATALATYERALAEQEALGDRVETTWTLLQIGRAQVMLGDASTAIKTLERAVRASEKLCANGFLVSALGALAAARLRSGDAGRAVSDAHRAVSLLRTLVGGLGEEQGATARGQYIGLFRTGLAAAAKLEDPSEAAFFLESGRAGTLLESLDARDALRHAALPDELRLAEATARAAEARSLVAYTKALDGGDLAVIRARNDDLGAARAKVQEVVERIQRDAKKEAKLWYPVATPIDDLQGLLAPGDALVLYGLDERDEPAHALVLTREEARIVPLGASSTLVAACEALEADDAAIDPAAALKRLRDLVVTPLGLAKETKRLLVSPEGPLSYVPFAALVPELVVAYQASGSTYGVLREEKDKRGTQVLALADPDYAVEYAPISLGLYAPGALASTGPTRGGRLAPLPGTRTEAMAVADVKLFGKDASEGGLRTALAARTERWHAVHFACHGLVNPDRPTLSSLALTPDGANDGFLTALEVLQLQIPSDLVVLSACETGKGKIAGGEGIVGLTRAFMYAGSPRVICSLWKVDDAATAALMTKFYELWSPKDGSKGLPTAEALRQAQAFVRGHEQWKHPYYWAAWVLWGLPD